MRQYGRQIQMMVEMATNMPDRQERQTHCQRIIKLMAKIANRSLNNVDSELELWNHLAYISNYQLDIDYPYPISHRENTIQRTRVPYPNTHIQRRHYGHILEVLAQKLKDTEDQDNRRQLVLSVARRMKQNLTEYRTDISTIEKIAQDIAYYTDGEVTEEEVKETCGKRFG